MAALAGLSLVTMAVSATIVAGALTPAVAQVSEEFEIALEPYGSWRPHPRFGQVWVPTGVPRDWRGGFKFERKHHLTTLERMVRWQEIAYD